MIGFLRIGVVADAFDDQRYGAWLDGMFRRIGNGIRLHIQRDRPLQLGAHLFFKHITVGYHGGAASHRPDMDMTLILWRRRGRHSHLALPGIHHPMFLAAPGEACLIIGLAVLRKGALCPLIHMANGGLLCVCGNDQCYGCMKITQCDPSC